MHTVYILRSLKSPDRIYVGSTADLDRRVKEHNRGDSLYAKRVAPWQVEATVSLRNHVLAKAFEMRPQMHVNIRGAFTLSEVEGYPSTRFACSG